MIKLIQINEYEMSNVIDRVLQAKGYTERTAITAEGISLFLPKTKENLLFVKTLKEHFKLDRGLYLTPEEALLKKYGYTVSPSEEAPTFEDTVFYNKEILYFTKTPLVAESNLVQETVDNGKKLLNDFITYSKGVNKNIFKDLGYENLIGIIEAFLKTEDTVNKITVKNFDCILKDLRKEYFDFTNTELMKELAPEDKAYHVIFRREDETQFKEFYLWFLFNLLTRLEIGDSYEQALKEVVVADKYLYKKFIRAYGFEQEYLKTIDLVRKVDTEEKNVVKKENTIIEETASVVPEVVTNVDENTSFEMFYSILRQEYSPYISPDLAKDLYLELGIEQDLAVYEKKHKAKFIKKIATNIEYIKEEAFKRTKDEYKQLFKDDENFTKYKAFITGLDISKTYPSDIAFDVMKENIFTPKKPKVAFCKILADYTAIEFIKAQEKEYGEEILRNHSDLNSVVSEIISSDKTTFEKVSTVLKTLKAIDLANPKALQKDLLLKVQAYVLGSLDELIHNEEFSDFAQLYKVFFN